VPVDAPPLKQARSLGENVIGEIELAAQFLPGPVVAITGSNGKTTTTTLAGEIMTASGFPTLVGGNIGTPAISLAERATPETVIVLEVSSFQLETIQTFRPKVAVVLNVTPDHLDRHHTFEIYVDAKARLFENQQSDDFAVLNEDDPTCVAMGARTKAQVFWFSRHKEVKQGAWVHDGKILFRDAKGQREILEVSDIPLKGAHNLENVLAAVCAGALMECPADKIRQAVRDFKAVEHRLEFVATIRGVDYYNDSKATNVDATLKAIHAFPGGLWIILGGKDKNSDYTLLAPPLKEKARAALLIGAAAEKIEAQLHGAIPLLQCGTLHAAIVEANARAARGDTVLLAPACASFDQFDNFEHRGREFKRLVQELPS